MYAFTWKNGHVVWRIQLYAFTLEVSLWADLHMIRENEVFVVDGMVTNSTWKMVVSSVISWPTNAVVELNAIAKICKYKRFHEGYYFILMAMEVHDTFEHDIGPFIRECVFFFHHRWSKRWFVFFFYIQFSRSMLILIFNML